MPTNRRRSCRVPLVVLAIGAVGAGDRSRQSGDALLSELSLYDHWIKGDFTGLLPEGHHDHTVNISMMIGQQPALPWRHRCRLVDVCQETRDGGRAGQGYAQSHTTCRATCFMSMTSTTSSSSSR